MCGIVGFVGEINNPLEKLNKAINKLNRRGPDANGYFVNEVNKVYLGHTRLSILDLSNKSNQPFIKNKNVICFNGEIYNHIKIREQYFKNYKFETNSDTETLIVCLNEYGLEKTLSLIEGMYVFIFYNFQENKIYIARDRFGEKPIYIIDKSNKFYFTSDLNCLSEIINLELSKQNLNFIFRYGFSNLNKTIFNDVEKVPSSSYLVYNLNSKQKFIKKYWSLSNQGKKNNFNDNDIYQVDKLIEQSVKKSLLSDAPLGVFLSSGIDSSLVAFYAANNSNKKIKSFSIGFDDYLFDESKESQKIANFLNLEHHTFMINKNDLNYWFDKIPFIFDTPIFDQSILPMSILSNHAKKYVKVCLSGDGADEIFLGYNRHKWLYKFDKLNNFQKKIFFYLLGNIGQKNLFNLYNFLYYFVPPSFRFNNIEDKINKIINLLNNNNNSFDSLMKIFDLNISEPSELPNNIDDLILFDRENYLIENILHKTDKTSMFSSLEVRSPYLNHNIYEFIKNFSTKALFKNDTNKFVLKEIIKNKFPATLINKTKKGFSSPIKQWINNDLNDKIINILKKRRDFIYYYTSIDTKKELIQYEYKFTNFNQIWSLATFAQWSINK